METIQTTLTTLKDVLTIIGLGLGGLWAWYKWRQANELSKQINMEVTTKEDPVDDKSSVLTIRIVLNNIGYRSLIPAAEGLEVSVKKLVASDQDRHLQWKRGELVFDEVDILAVYKAGEPDYKKMYRLDRGGVYHETCALTVDRGHVYLIQAGLWLDADTLQIEYCYHVSPDSLGTVASLSVTARTELQSANQSIQATSQERRS